MSTPVITLLTFLITANVSEFFFFNILHPPFSSNRFFCSSRHFLIFSGSSLVTGLVGADDANNSVTQEDQNYWNSMNKIKSKFYN